MQAQMPNNSLNRSGINSDGIRKTWMLDTILPARLIRALDVAGLRGLFMNYTYIVGILFAITFLGFMQSADTKPQIASSMIHIDRKVRGIVTNFACEPLSEARITFRNKKQIQIITPDQNGHFLVDLPLGDYQVIVELPADSAYKIASPKLEVSPSKNGEPCIWVDTGIEATHCYCFESNDWDQFFPLPPNI